MYKLIENKKNLKELKDGKYFLYSKVEEVNEEGLKVEGSDVFFLSIFRINKKDFVRIFFTKEKESFIVDIVQKIDFDKFLQVNEIFQKYKNLYI